MTATDDVIMPSSGMTSASLTRAESDAQSLSLKTYVDLRVAELLTDVRARREGMAAEEATHRREHEREHERLAQMVTGARTMADDLLHQAFKDHQREHEHIEALMQHKDEVTTWREGLGRELITLAQRIDACVLTASFNAWRDGHMVMHTDLLALIQRETAICTARALSITDANATEHKDLLARIEREKEIGQTTSQAYIVNHSVEHQHVRDDMKMMRDNGLEQGAARWHSHDLAHERQREADTLGEAKLDTRLEGMNGFSRTFRDIQQLAVTRDQLDDRVDAVMSKVDSATGSSAAGVTRIENALAAQVQRLEAALVDLQTSRAQQTGKSTAYATMIGIASVVISLLVSISLHFIR